MQSKSVRPRARAARGRVQAIRCLAATTVLCALLAPPARAQTASQFTDWISEANNTAVGTLAGASVTLTGTHVWPYPQSIFDGSDPIFGTSSFTPPLPLSDSVQFSGSDGFAYVLSFGAPVTDPILDLQSLASTLVFPGGTKINRLSGQPGFTVSGATVDGVHGTVLDSDGTAQLIGTFTTIPITTLPHFGPGVEDGISLEVGVPVVATPTPHPEPTVAPPTSTPPPPPAPPDARNLTPPQIVGLGGKSYRCNAGAWSGLAASPDFTYVWYRINVNATLRNHLPPSSPVATVDTYTVPPSGVGQSYFCLVTATGQSGTRVSAASPMSVLGLPSRLPLIVTKLYGNVRVRGIDVFQIVQPNAGATMFGYPTGGFPALCGGGTPTTYQVCNPGPVPTQAPYAGVDLDPDKPTTAVVYVDMQDIAATDAAQPVNVTLTAYLGGRALPGAITRSELNPPVSATPWVTQAERLNPGNGVRFDLPVDWLEQADSSGAPLDLGATVSLPTGPGIAGERECVLLPGPQPCVTDDSFRLTGLKVLGDLPTLTIYSLPLLADSPLAPNAYETVASFPGPDTVIQPALNLFPGGEHFIVRPYGAALDIKDAAGLKWADAPCKPFRTIPPTPATQAADLRSCRQAAVQGRLDDWWRSDPRNRTGYDILMAVHDYPGEPGWYRGGSVATPGTAPTIVINDGTLGRPLTAAAHELGHALGLPHADPKPPGLCGPPSGAGEQWPPDQTGRLQSVGYVRGSGPDTLRGDTATTPFYDIMSYCTGGNDATAWLSARNWEHVFSVLRTLSATRRTLAAAPPASAGRTGGGYMTGVIGPGGAQITGVVPAAPGNLAPAADPASDLQVTALDAHGRMLGEAGAQVLTLHNDGLEEPTEFFAPIPAGADSVQVSLGGTLVATRRRSRPPTVRVLAPGRHVHVGARGALTVRWRASDPDGGPLQVSIEYAADGATGWHTVFMGPSSGSAAVPASFLEAGTHARVRVSIDDGFNRVHALSAPFRAAGAPPTARIVTPAAGTRVQAGGVLLSGAALDVTGQFVPGRRLTWFAGHRRLGTGRRLHSALAAGRVRLRLQARDAHGRTGTSTRTVLVTAVKLTLPTFTAPAQVSASASHVSVKVAASVPATLRAGGRRYRVGPHVRTLALALPAHPATGLLRVPLTVRAAGLSQPPLRAMLTVVRR